MRNLGRGGSLSAAAARRRARGFTLFELVMVVSIISILVVFAISRLIALQVDAERVAMETMLGTLRSALGIKVAECIVNQDRAGLQALAGSNPMDRLAEMPRNYLGAFNGVDPAALADGSWYFDTASRTLVYLVRFREYFVGGLGDPPRARFAVRLVYTDKNHNGVFDPGVDVIEGVRLVAVEPYHWKH